MRSINNYQREGVYSGGLGQYDSTFAIPHRSGVPPGDMRDSGLSGLLLPLSGLFSDFIVRVRPVPLFGFQSRSLLYIPHCSPISILGESHAGGIDW
ncbi:hypothetical protein SUGI_1447170 [Cryptomeria japonica]|uniref:Uncharacterized protein n=1 Tax=Cryptomeria japonica TaxID=3369 RepID=A0AAD3NRL7_CRYJA|nr:hypothetical protein SUGI_1373050 [Cryptomeria japonica]GLJ58416.1 hypothetical protein SUGI_1447170 [Cryptomeria japonica]